jgi:hypothetical protein
MKITVCEFPDEGPRKEAAWIDLVRFLQASPTDVAVLPEMPFCDWQIFLTRTIDPAVWGAALAVHDAMIARFVELQAALVLASRPVEVQGQRLNQAFCWTREGGYRGARPDATPAPALLCGPGDPVGRCRGAARGRETSSRENNQVSALRGGGMPRRTRHWSRQGKPKTLELGASP